MKTLYESIFDNDLATKRLPVFGDYFKFAGICLNEMNISLEDQDAYVYVLQHLNVKNILKKFPQYDCKIDDDRVLKLSKNHADLEQRITVFIQTILAIPISNPDNPNFIEDIKEFLKEFKKYYSRIDIFAYPSFGDIVFYIRKSQCRYYFTDDDYETSVTINFSFQKK